MIVVIDRKVALKAAESYYMYLKGRRRPDRLRGFTSRLGPAVPEKCLICQGDITLGGGVVLCPYCGSTYHFECLKTLSEESEVPMEELQCFYCGKKLPMSLILELAGGRV